MTRRPSEARVRILVAMLTRGAPLIRGHRWWFVRDWAVPVFTADVEALRDGGWIAPPADAAARGRHRVLVLSAAGGALAAGAVSAGRAEEIAA